MSAVGSLEHTVRHRRDGEAMMKNNRAVRRWELGGWVFLFIFAFTDLFSISVAQIAAAGMGICWLGRWAASRQRPGFSPAGWPLAAFVAASLVAAGLSLDPAESIRDSKDLLHILIFFAAFDLFTRSPERVGAVFRVIAASGGGIALVGLGQAVTRGVNLHDRISGFNDIYMTYAGLLMLAITLGGAVALFSFRKWRDGWLPAAIAVMTFAVLLSLTRNAWIGLLVGGVTLLALRKPAWALIAPVAAALAITLAPAGVKERVYSMADPDNRSNRERLLLWSAGMEIIADHPLFGVGQNSFPLVYPKYRRPGVTEPNISHLHNNFIELGAERGLVGLACWIAVWAAALWSMAAAWIKRKPGEAEKTGLAGAMGAVAAFLAAGLFEYNFGDSELQMMYYFVLAAGLASAQNASVDHEKAVSGGGRERVDP